MTDDDRRPVPPIEWAVVIPAQPPVDGSAAAPIAAPPGRGPMTRAVAALVLVAMVSTAVATAVVTRSARGRMDPQAATTMARGPLVGPDGTSYAYTWVNSDGTPVRWNPCEPVDWVSSSRLAPPGALADFRQALDRISAVSGLRFRYRGEVDERPATSRVAAQPQAYGDGWAPMLVAWAPLVGTALGAGLGTVADTVGVATPVAVSEPGGRGVIVTAQIVFETSRSLPAGFASSGSRGAVMLHELAHALGLAHVADASQLMYDGDHADSGAGELRAGDVAGLAGVGAAGGCLDEPEPDDVG